MCGVVFVKKFSFLLSCLLVMTFLFGNSNFVRAANNLSSLGNYSTQYKYTMYLGTNDKNTLKQEIPTDRIRKEMHEICMKYVDGYTVTIAEGYYRDSNNEISHETSLVYVFLDTDITALRKIMDEALIKFNQKSILLEESNSKSIFYSAPE